MAIKHLGNTSNKNAPTTGQVKERELVINTTNKVTYTSSDGTDIVRLALGGVAYDVLTSYNKGDIVVKIDGTGGPFRTFISLVNNNFNFPLPVSSLNVEWQEIDTFSYNATTGGDTDGDGAFSPAFGSGMHCPWDSVGGTPGAPGVPANGANPLGEYPNIETDVANPERVGATWYISGLGYDSNNDSIQYVFTTGPLTGITVADGDRISWVDVVFGAIPPDTDEVWFHTPYPRINGERAGMLWRAGEDYVIGDVVSQGESNFVATVPTVGSNPMITPTEWKKLDGYEIWDASSLAYTPGVIVQGSDGNDYVLTVSSAYSGQNPTGGLPWVEVTADKERGGVSWFEDFQYATGDIVTGPNGKVYRSLVDNPSATDIPGTNSLKWKAVGGLSLWESTVIYDEGDVVFWGDQIYIAPAGGVPAGTTPPAAPWLTEGTSVYVNVAGDTMTGDLFIPTDATPSTTQVMNRDMSDDRYVNETGDTMTGALTIPNATANGHAMNRTTSDGRYVNVTGDTMTGNLTVPNATANGHAMNRTTSDGRYVNVVGDSMTGDLIMGGNQVRNIGAPLDSDDAIRRDTWAASTLGGTLKARLSGTDLYLTNNGNNA